MLLKIIRKLQIYMTKCCTSWAAFRTFIYRLLFCLYQALFQWSSTCPDLGTTFNSQPVMWHLPKLRGKAKWVKVCRHGASLSGLWVERPLWGQQAGGGSGFSFLQPIFRLPPPHPVLAGAGCLLQRLLFEDVRICLNLIYYHNCSWSKNQGVQSPTHLGPVAIT